MVLRILADANIRGHVARLDARLQAAPWREFADYLQLQFVSFSDLGLDPEDPDDTLWQYCQQHEIILLTNNRNSRGPDSLEATIRARNTAECLPVFTVGDADEILENPEYADRVVERLLDFLMRLETLRGSGRLYVP